MLNSFVGALYAKLLFVALAFIIMVVSSCLYVNDMLHSHLNKDAAGMLDNTKLEIESELLSLQSTLGPISQSIDDMIINGSDEDAVRSYMLTLTGYMENDETMLSLGYSGVYGYFDAFGGAYLDGTGWNAPADYSPEASPWYKKAAGANGGIVMLATPNTAPDSHGAVITCAQGLLGKDGGLLGVVCIDMPLVNIDRYVSGLKLTKNGYGILEDENFTIIAHPSADLLGKNVYDVRSGLSTVADAITAGQDIFEREVVNYYNEKVIMFNIRLDNGWILTIVTPRGEYYQELFDLVLVLGIIGALLAAALIIIILRIDKARHRSDEDNRQKSVRLAAMEKERESDEYAQLLFDATPLGCTLFDKNYNVVACNEAIVKLYGFSGKQEYIDRFFELSPEYQPCGRPSSEMVTEILAKTFSEGYDRFEWTHRKLSGELIPAEVTTVRLRHKGAYIVAGFTRDLREIKATLDDLQNARDAAESANKAKSAFLANMSHEMRTPLNVIVGFSDLRMEDDKLADDVKGDIQKINSAGQLLLGIVNDVLDISKIEAGKLTVTPVVYSTASLLNDIITLNMIRIEGKPVTFQADISAELYYELYGDDLRVTQIFNNILGNAFKYTREGSVELRVSCGRDSGGYVWLSFSVSDSGIGIRAEDLKKLFSDYNQVDTKANRKIEGTGLGLSISKKLAELMDGDITVESEYGKGSTFYVRLRQGYVGPKVLGREMVENICGFRYRDQKQHASAKLVRPDLSYAKVLVVDDFPTNLDVAAGMMRKYKMQVDCVTSGRAAVERVKGGQPVYDAIFMDHMMPEMDGIEAAKLIRGLNTDYALKVPIIALTANAIAGSSEMFLKSGFQDFLSKPINIMKLDAAIKKWVAKPGENPGPPKQPAPDPGPERDQDGQPIKIPGIDAAKGLALYDGDAELYMSVIRSYRANTPAVLEKLRDVTGENLREYAINVHGLKGASANIGAEDIREKALRLELTAKAGDLPGVLAANGGLLADTQALLTAIEQRLTEIDGKNARQRLHAPDPAVLCDLRQCCERFDMSGADDAMSRLERAEYDAGAGLVARLRERIDTSDFPEAAKLIREYEEGLESEI